MTSPMALVRRLLSKAPTTRFHVQYQPDFDLFFASIGDPQMAESVEVDTGIYARISDETHEVVSIEILECAQRFGMKPEQLDAGFAEHAFRQYADRALKTWSARHQDVSSRLVSAAR